MFQIGQRIVAARAMTGIRQGACGTIARVYAGIANIYDVHFDRKGLVRLIGGALLAPLRTRAEVARCRRDT